MPTETSSRAAVHTPTARIVEQWGQYHGISRSRVYELINGGTIVAQKLGGRTLIFDADNENFRKSLPAIQPKPTVRP